MDYYAICPECQTIKSGSRLAARSFAEDHNQTHNHDPCKIVGPTALSMQEFLGYLSCNYDREAYIRAHEWLIDADPLG